MPPLQARAGFVEPDYSGRSLGDVLPAVATALGVGIGVHETSLVLPPAPAYVVMLVDGLGHELLAEHRSQAPYLHSLLGEEPATCGVPSTTATSLTSLGTALTPGQHGLVGFTSRVPETGELLNSLFWDKPVDPLEWQPHRTAFDRLEGAGVHTSVVSKREFAGSGLTRCGQRGAEYVGADDLTERIDGAVAGAGRRPSLTYVYDGDLDWHGHRAGVDSQRWRAQLRDIDEDVQELREALPDEVRLLVVADHGMVDSTPGDGTSTSTSSRACATAWPCWVARRGSGTSTAGAARSRTSRPPGARSSATRPPCSPATRRSPAAGSAPWTTAYACASGTSSWPPTTTGR